MKRKIGICIITGMCILFTACANKPTDVEREFPDTVTKEEVSNLMTGENELSINSTNDGVNVGELLDCAEYLGKSASEIGIPAEVCEEYMGDMSKTYLDGTILDTTDYAVLYFDDKPSNPDKKARRMWVHVKTVKYEDLYEALVSRYGEPVGEGSLPYAAVNDGAMMWTDFETDTMTIRIEIASERDYLNIQYELKK